MQIETLNRKRAQFVLAFGDAGGEGAVEEGVAEVDLEAAQDLRLGLVLNGEVGVAELLLEGLGQSLLFGVVQGLVRRPWR